MEILFVILFVTGALAKTSDKYQNIVITSPLEQQRIIDEVVTISWKLADQSKTPHGWYSVALFCNNDTEPRLQEKHAKLGEMHLSFDVTPGDCTAKIRYCRRRRTMCSNQTTNVSFEVASPETSGVSLITPSDGFATAENTITLEWKTDSAEYNNMMWYRLVLHDERDQITVFNVKRKPGEIQSLMIGLYPEQYSVKLKQCLKRAKHCMKYTEPVYFTVKDDSSDGESDDAPEVFDEFTARTESTVETTSMSSQQESASAVPLATPETEASTDHPATTTLESDTAADATTPQPGSMSPSNESTTSAAQSSTNQISTSVSDEPGTFVQPSDASLETTEQEISSEVPVTSGIPRDQTSQDLRTSSGQSDVISADTAENFEPIAAAPETRMKQRLKSKVA